MRSPTFCNVECLLAFKNIADCEERDLAVKHGLLIETAISECKCDIFFIKPLEKCCEHSSISCIYVFHNV